MSQNQKITTSYHYSIQKKPISTVWNTFSKGTFCRLFFLWIEATGAADKIERRGDGVSRLFVGDADYLAAWAVDERGRPIYSVDGGDVQREMSTRFGVNLIIYILTGNYKEDQVHIPALLERLGEDEGVGDFDLQDGVIP